MRYPYRRLKFVGIIDCHICCGTGKSEDKKEDCYKCEGEGWLTLTTMKEFDRANAIIESITTGIKN